MKDTKDKKYLFETAGVPYALAVMALPAVVSQLIALIYNLADTWFIGRTNNPYMVASCSLVLPIYMLAVVISNVFGVGGGTLIAAVFFYDHTDDIRGDLAERLAQVQVVQQVLFPGG